jgi:hypothetical protein
VKDLLIMLNKIKSVLNVIVMIKKPIHAKQRRKKMPKFDKVKDSGKRQEFKTGSVRDTNIGKGRYDLISPLMLQRLAKHFENGAVKYGDRNWEKGQPLSRYFDSTIRHLYKHLEGMRDEDHLAAAIWNIGAMIHTEELIERELLPKELSDLPNYLQKERNE